MLFFFFGGGGGGQDKPAWTACPPGVKITRVGVRYPGTACPGGGGASCPGGKINWDTGSLQTVGNISMEIFIDGEIIKEVENQKLLGVIIDKTLSWDKQIDAVCLNVTRRITLMNLLSKYLDQSHLNQYYN